MSFRSKGQPRRGDRFAPRRDGGPPGFRPRHAAPPPRREGRPVFRRAPEPRGFSADSRAGGNGQDRGESGDEKICRLNPLLEVLKASPSRVTKIFVQNGQGPHRLGEVLREAREGGVPFVFVPREKLDRMAAHHQGVVAFLAPKEYSSLEDLIAAPGTPFLVLLDEVEDPQNVGAIVRSAEAAGATGLILPERRSAGLTEAVATVSAGALAHLKVARVANLAQAMESLKAAGIWLVGAEAPLSLRGSGPVTPGEQAPPSSRGSGPVTSGEQGGTAETYESFDYTVPVGIVLGSEGRGLRPLVRKRCDKVLSIPMAGHVNSLNVASAAAVFLFEVVRQRRGKTAGQPPAD